VHLLHPPDVFFVHVTWLIHICDMTHSYVRHDSFICATWLIHTCDMTHPHVWHDPFIRMTWLIHICDMTRSYVWQYSFIYVTWLIHTYDMTHSYVRHDSFIRLAWLIHMCNMTRSYVWHDTSRAPLASTISKTLRSVLVCVCVCVLVCVCVYWRVCVYVFVCVRVVNLSVSVCLYIYCCHLSCALFMWHDSFIWVSWLIHTCDLASSYVWHDSFICVTWLIQGTVGLNNLKNTAYINVVVQALTCVAELRCVCVCVCVCVRVCVCVCLCVYCIYQCCRTGTFLRRRTLVCVCVRDLTLSNVYEWMATLTHVSALWNESCHFYEWLMSIIWTRHSHARMSNVTYVNESCHTYAWVITNIWTKCMNQICEFICVTWLIIMCDMTHLFVWHD